jgi:hydroxyacylglutathione hydrolase
MPTLRVDAVDAFNDNYIWILDDGAEAVVVDPGQAAPVVRYLEENRLRLAGLLLTHHHADHIGGVEDLVGTRSLPVFGPDDPRMAAVNRPCAHGDTVRFERPSLRFEVIETPGHTTSHIAFHGHGRLFCGDTLFSVGCGRMFEGTPAQMLRSLDRLAALPADTAVHCAHEYTRSNCTFARTVDPDNRALLDRCAEVDRLRRDRQRTVPSRLDEERACNPFLRTRDPDLIAAARRHDARCDGTPESVFATLRAWKDDF